jgi:hypothetical protein
LDRQNITSRAIAMNSTTPRRTNPTILRVEDLFLLDDEVLSRVVDPPEEFEGGGAFEGGDGGASVGFRPVGVVVGVGACFGPVGVGIGAGPADAEGGDADGAIVVLNGLPSILKVGMFSNFGGTGPENKLFATFKSFKGRSCKALRVPDS